MEPKSRLQENGMVFPNGFEPSTFSVSSDYGFVGEKLTTN